MGMELDGDAAAVYRAMLEDHTRTVADLAAALSITRPRVRKALDVLADAALLRPDQADPLLLVPSHPRVGMARLVAEAEAELAAQAQRVAAVRSLMETMALEHDAHRHREAIVHHDTLEGVRDRLEELSLEARTECVSLNPGRAHRPDAMAASKPLNQRALERGVAIRAVYQESFRHDPATLDYARWLTQIGGEARTMPEVPMLLVIVDREVALLPRVVGDPSQGAVEVRTPSVVAALVEYFETTWLLAAPFGEVRKREEPLSNATSRQLLQMLAAGATDEAAARRLGLSTRTVRRLMSDFMASTGAASRFQAGVEAVRRGLLG
jgi:DNA-binding CsgD family transcriptional regulator/sugar-specific transcriptional regulator TrmB